MFFSCISLAQGDIFVLEVLADHAAIAMQNVRLVHETLGMRDSYINAITDLGSSGVMRSITKRAMSVCNASDLGSLPTSEPSRSGTNSAATHSCR